MSLLTTTGTNERIASNPDVDRTIPTTEPPSVAPLSPPRLIPNPKSPEQLAKIEAASELTPDRLREILRSMCLVPECKISIPPSTKVVEFDFDGTIADTEPLHEAAFDAAVLRRAGVSIRGDNWEKFKPAFGLPEIDSCKTIVRVLEESFPEAFKSFFKSSGRNWDQYCDSLPPQKSAILEQLAFYLRAERIQAVKAWATVAKVEAFEAQDCAQLKIGIPDHMKLDGFLSAFKGVSVTTHRNILEILNTCSSKNIITAIVTSSGNEFVTTVLDRMGILNLFNVIVCAEDVTEPKPHADPWRKALRQINSSYKESQAKRLGVSRDEIPPLTAKEVLAFENTVGGAISAFLAGFTVVVSNSDGKHRELADGIVSASVKKYMGAAPAMRRRAMRAAGDPRMLVVPGWGSIQD